MRIRIRVGRHWISSPCHRVSTILLRSHHMSTIDIRLLLLLLHRPLVVLIRLLGILGIHGRWRWVIHALIRCHASLYPHLIVHIMTLLRRQRRRQWRILLSPVSANSRRRQIRDI